MAKTPPRLAILGAGPIGIEAALYARQLKLPFVLFERGQVGEYLRRWGHVKLFTPMHLNLTPLGRQALRGRELPADDTLLTGREYLAQVLQPLAEALKDSLRPETLVMQAGKRDCLKQELHGEPGRARSPFRLLVRDKAGERSEEADVVLDCTGVYGQHRWLGRGGIPALGEVAAEGQITYGLDDLAGERRKDFVGRTILVVGAGFSAATSVVQLADLAAAENATWIIWLARAPHTQPLRRVPNDPLRERDRLAVRANNLATRTDHNVEFHPSSWVEAIESLGQDKGYRVHCSVGGAARAWEVDRIVANVGAMPNLNLCRELQVQESFAANARLGPRSSEPNYYLLGAKALGRDSSFLLRQGFDHVREVFAQIQGDPKLDLYR